jgi:hypothetical protein
MQQVNVRHDRAPVSRNATFWATACLAVLAGCGPATDAAKTPLAEIGTPAGQPVAVADKVRDPAGQPVAVDDKVREPATVDEAARLLDLRAFPTLAAAHFWDKTLGALVYEAQADLKEAMQFQRQHLTERGWKELPGSRLGPAEAQGYFTQEGFVVWVSVSETEKAGRVHVSIHNSGNVRPGKEPVPADAKPEYRLPTTAGYVTTAKVADMAEACRKLLVEKGWQPYGGHVSQDKVATMHSLKFKRNALLLNVLVSTHENRPGQTMIQYSTGLVSADLPAPATAVGPTFRYNDQRKILQFETADRVDEVADFYRQALARQDWKPTTEPKGLKEVVMVFFNPRKDMITLYIKASPRATRVVVRHYTAEEHAALERQREGKKGPIRGQGSTATPSRVAGLAG